MTSLLIVRHGQSEWNLTGKWQGQADPPLTELGKRQAEIAAHTLAEQQAHAARQTDAAQQTHQAHNDVQPHSPSGAHLQRVISSDLERARHTAEILADVLGIADLIVDQALRERHAGEWEGLTKDEIEQQWPGAIAQRDWPPNFESEQSVAKRLLPALRRLCAGLAPSAAVLLVGHAGVVKTVDQYVGAPEGPVPNLAGRWYKISGGAQDGTTAGDASGVGGREAASGNAARWGWEQLIPGEKVEFVPSDIDLAIE